MINSVLQKSYVQACRIKTRVLTTARSLALSSRSNLGRWYLKKGVWLDRVFLGFFIGLLGVLFSWAPLGFDLEESFGLPFLFWLRGPISTPSEPVVVAIDKASADQLGLPISPNLWPRNLHARLIENLTKAGAHVIAFDLRFDTPGKLPEQDMELANAVRNAGNVVIVERLDQEVSHSVTDRSGRTYPGGLMLKPAPLLPMIADAAVARTTFTLPRASYVNYYWAFNPGSGDAPTLPVVVLQLVALQAYKDFVRLLGNVSPSLAMQLPTDRNAIVVENLILTLRSIFTAKPQIAQHMLRELNRDLSLDQKTRGLIKSLLSLYSGDEKRYLNFYGPPRTVLTIPYYQALQSPVDLEANGIPKIDFRGKAVFVGFSAGTQSEQDRVRDDYHTVFSQSDGLYISGVEIAATAFANLLKDQPVRRLATPADLIIVFIWGFAIAIVCIALPDWKVVKRSRRLVILYILVVLSIGVAIYITIASYQFKETGIWLPLFVPLVLQVLFTAFGAVSLRNYEAWWKRKALKESLVPFVSKQVLDPLWDQAEPITLSSRWVYGTCLVTDIEKYTNLAEQMVPAQLRRLLEDYYESLIQSVYRHDGNILDVGGDAMLAIWASSSEDQSLQLRNKACHACLDIAEALERLNKVEGRPPLYTRIGLHSGEVVLGCLGAPGHYEYRATGDTVNTTSRIQDLNKRLRTRLLVSDKVIEGLDDFLTRPLGTFPLRGRAAPARIVELVARKQEAGSEQLWLCEAFASAMRAYELKKWGEGCRELSAILKAFPSDGPAQYYLELCQRLPLRNRRQ